MFCFAPGALERDTSVTSGAGAGPRVRLPRRSWSWRRGWSSELSGSSLWSLRIPGQEDGEREEEADREEAREADRGGGDQDIR